MTAEACANFCNVALYSAFGIHSGQFCSCGFSSDGELISKECIHLPDEACQKSAPCGHQCQMQPLWFDPSSFAVDMYTIDGYKSTSGNSYVGCFHFHSDFAFSSTNFPQMCIFCAKHANTSFLAVRMKQFICLDSTDGLVPSNECNSTMHGFDVGEKIFCAQDKSNAAAVYKISEFNFFQRKTGRLVEPDDSTFSCFKISISVFPSQEVHVKTEREQQDLQRHTNDAYLNHKIELSDINLGPSKPGAITLRDIWNVSSSSSSSYQPKSVATAHGDDGGESNSNDLNTNRTVGSTVGYVNNFGDSYLPSDVFPLSEQRTNFPSTILSHSLANSTTEIMPTTMMTTSDYHAKDFSKESLTIHYRLQPKLNEASSVIIDQKNSSTTSGEVKKYNDQAIYQAEIIPKKKILIAGSMELQGAAKMEQKLRNSSVREEIVVDNGKNSNNSSLDYDRVATNKVGKGKSVNELTKINSENEFSKDSLPDEHDSMKVKKVKNHPKKLFKFGKRNFKSSRVISMKTNPNVGKKLLASYIIYVNKQEHRHSNLGALGFPSSGSHLAVRDLSANSDSISKKSKSTSPDKANEVGVMVGQTVVVPCLVMLVKPKVSWFRDGNPIASSGRFQTQENGALKISIVQTSDIGKYECLAVGKSAATNKVMKQKQKSYLLVRKPAYLEALFAIGFQGKSCDPGRVQRQISLVKSKIGKLQMPLKSRCFDAAVKSSSKTGHELWIWTYARLPPNKRTQSCDKKCQVNLLHSQLSSVFEWAKSADSASAAGYQRTKTDLKYLIQCDVAYRAQIGGCEPCPPGTYGFQNWCYRCPKGSYQTGYAQSSCHFCSFLVSTPYTGADSKDLCSIVDYDSPVITTSFVIACMMPIIILVVILALHLQVKPKS